LSRALALAVLGRGRFSDGGAAQGLGVSWRFTSPGTALAEPPPHPGGFADHFGELFGGEFIAVPIFSKADIHDDGGVRLSVLIYGALDGTYFVSVGGISCFSGVAGQGPRILPTGPSNPHPNSGEHNPLAERKIRFITPAGLATGDHDLVLTAPWASWTLADVIHVERRPRRAGEYAMRRHMPKSSYGALRGPGCPDDGPVFDP